MPEEVKLFTQADLSALNEQLNVILNNLNTHVNASLSKVHSVKVLPQAYYDDGGDLVNSHSAGFPVVLEFQFGEPPGTTTLYVPARIVNSATSWPSIRDPGPRTVSNGVVYSATSPAGTSTSPGIPQEQKALVTTSPAAVAYTQSVIYNDLLLLHQQCSIQDVRELQCHGGITYSSQNTHDTLGHLVGQKTVNIGYGGVLYKLPANPRISGPVQVPRNLKIYVGGTHNPWHNWSHHARDDDGYSWVGWIAPQADVAPTLTWQANVFTHYRWNGTWSIGASWYDLGWIGQSGSWSAGESGSWQVESNGVLRGKFSNGSDHTYVKQFVRLKATNASVYGGGTIYSNVVAMLGNDEDGGWFSGPDEAYWTGFSASLPGASTLYW